MSTTSANPTAGAVTPTLDRDVPGLDVSITVTDITGEVTGEVTLVWEEISNRYVPADECVQMWMSDELVRVVSTSRTQAGSLRTVDEDWVAAILAEAAAAAQRAYPRGSPARLTEYIIMTATAEMPASVRSKYGRIAVVEVDRTVLDALGIDTPRMISERARGVVRVVETWERLHVGVDVSLGLVASPTARCAFGRAMREAQERLVELERGAGPRACSDDVARGEEVTCA
jgi:hypothetical protein